jgi:hypothetical protein
MMVSTHAIATNTAFASAPGAVGSPWHCGQSAAGNRIKIDRWGRRLQIVVSDEPHVADLGRAHGITPRRQHKNGTERPVILSSGAVGLSMYFLIPLYFLR